jgi:hypothetical protein
MDRIRGGFMMNRVRQAVWAAAVAAFLGVSAFAVPAIPAEASSVVPQWRTSYQLHASGAVLTGVTAPAAGAVWVTGRYRSGSDFLLRWNGRSWRLRRMPVAGFHAATIVSSSPFDVWLFGWTTTKLMALRWNGKSWHRTSWPGVLYAPQSVSVVAWNDVWLSNGAQVEHWNGHVWTAVAMPARCGGDQLSAGSGTDVWAVNVPADDPGSQSLVVCQWTGHAWHEVHLPRSGKETFVRLLATSATSVWISSNYLVWHLSGRTWHVISGVEAFGSPQLALASYGASGLWTGASDLWTGRAWISPTGPGYLLPQAIASVPGSTQAWMVGGDQEGQVVLRAT